MLPVLRPFLFSRLVIFAILLIVPCLKTNSDEYRSLQVQPASFVGTVCVADVIPYHEIATKGYDRPETYAFFPLWPVVLRLLGGNLLLGTLVANALFFLALLAFYKI